MTSNLKSRKKDVAKITKRMKQQEKAKDLLLKKQLEEREAMLERKHEREQERKEAIARNLAKEK